jgi:hypothetical protein
MNGPGESLGKEPALSAPGQTLSKGEHDLMVKCAKCGTENHVFVKVVGDKQEPEQGPHEDGKKSAELLETPEFKKLFEDFKKSIDDRNLEMEKSYKVKIDEYELALKASNARIDELHKSIDMKSKALETEEQAMAKETIPEVKKEAKETRTFSVFPQKKAF